MELSKMKHDLNEVWIDISNPDKMRRIIKIIDANPAHDSRMVIPEPRDVYVIRMVLGYIALKHMLEMKAKRELEEQMGDG